jgi:hypothetical protein
MALHWAAYLPFELLFDPASRTTQGARRSPEGLAHCVEDVQVRSMLFYSGRGSSRCITVWRPNLPDEGDNHVLELAVAAGNAPIVTLNRRDFRSGELRFPGIIVQTPGAWLKSLAPLKE